MRWDRREFLRHSSAAAAGLVGVGSLVNLGAGAAAPANAPEGARPNLKRWAMVVDVQKCLAGKTKGCVQGCNEAHNIPQWNDERLEVKWIWEEKFSRLFPDETYEHMPAALRTVPAPALCNHCANPPCVRVCPTQATFRRSDGIVGMDMHRCIGCRFCITACPYGARSFNWKDPREAENLKEHINPSYPTRARGVVEKCTFCVERLAKGRLPACVEAAEDEALIFGDLNDPNSKIVQTLESSFTIRRRPNLETEPQVYYLIRV